MHLDPRYRVVFSYWVVSVFHPRGRFGFPCHSPRSVVFNCFLAQKHAMCWLGKWRAVTERALVVFSFSQHRAWRRGGTKAEEVMRTASAGFVVSGQWGRVICLSISHKFVGYGFSLCPKGIQWSCYCNSKQKKS